MIYILFNNKPGPAQVDAISKAQKLQKDFKVSKYCLLQHPKIFFEKSLTMSKKLKRGTLQDFSTSILPQNSKKIEGDTLEKFFSEKKSRNAKKTERGDLLVSSGILCYAGNLFGSVLWVNRDNLKFCRTFGRTILVTSGVSKKTLTKSYDHSQLFSRAPTKRNTVKQTVTKPFTFQ